MQEDNKRIRIKILKNGPYVVTGNVPLVEKILTPKGKEYEFVDGNKLPQSERYELCRCGKSKNPPFCDHCHEESGFDGTETASRDKFEERADVIEGPELTLLDDHRCALARFCHRKDGNAWWLTRNSDNPRFKKEAIIAATECPAGRLVVLDKDGNAIEPEFEPSICIIQDPERGVSGGIYVKGYIPIESSDGYTYEVRNRVVLCRCGQSENKPFCDASHMTAKFLDK